MTGVVTPRRNLRRSLAVALTAAAVALPLVAVPRLGTAAAPASAKLPALHTYEVAGPGAQFVGFASRIIVASRSGTLTFYNLDIAQHNLVSATPGLFFTPLIGLGQHANVQGLSTLPLGTYKFVCTIHAAMVGSLHLIA